MRHRAGLTSGEATKRNKLRLTKVREMPSNIRNRTDHALNPTSDRKSERLGRPSSTLLPGHMIPVVAFLSASMSIFT
jgi:hypothetical protein